MDEHGASLPAEAGSTEDQSREGVLAPGAPATAELRPALTLGWAVAAAGTRRRPPVSPPGPLRPLVRFARLPDRALETVRQVLDDDAEFRAEVAAAAEEAVIGRVSWLWLTQPASWEAELAKALDAGGPGSHDRPHSHQDRETRQRVERLQSAAARLEAELAASRADVEAAVGRIGELRQQLRQEGEERRGLEAAVTEVRNRETAERLRRQEAERHLHEVRSTEAALRDDLGGQRSAREDAEREVARLRAALAGGRQQLQEAGRRQAEQRAAADDRDRRLGSAIADAARAASHLGQALADAAEVLGSTPAADAPPDWAGRPGRPRAPMVAGPSAHDAGDDQVGADHPGRTGRPAGPEGAGGRRRPERRARKGASLPPAVFDDSAEAAAHLVRLSGAVVVVDGYNVTLSAWPELELVDQRDHLVLALNELCLRTGVVVEVVFDGVDQGSPPAAGAAAAPAAGVAGTNVRVDFSPAGVEADEVIIDRVRELPPDVPVVVATDDRRVRTEVSEGGANVLSVEQLLGVLGRRGRGAR